jgi:hypothetical protein
MSHYKQGYEFVQPNQCLFDLVKSLIEAGAKTWSSNVWNNVPALGLYKENPKWSRSADVYKCRGVLVLDADPPRIIDILTVPGIESIDILYITQQVLESYYRFE